MANPNVSKWNKFLCFLGLHGPDVFGGDSCERSSRIEPFTRMCWYCHSVWVGEEIEVRNVRRLGGWRKVK